MIIKTLTSSGTSDLGGLHPEPPGLHEDVIVALEVDDLALEVEVLHLERAQLLDQLTHAVQVVQTQLG